MFRYIFIVLFLFVHVFLAQEDVKEEEEEEYILLSQYTDEDLLGLGLSLSNNDEEEEEEEITTAASVGKTKERQWTAATTASTLAEEEVTTTTATTEVEETSLKREEGGEENMEIDADKVRDRERDARITTLIAVEIALDGIWEAVKKVVSDVWLAASKHPSALMALAALIFTFSHCLCHCFICCCMRKKKNQRRGFYQVQGGDIEAAAVYHDDESDGHFPTPPPPPLSSPSLLRAVVPLPPPPPPSSWLLAQSNGRKNEEGVGQNGVMRSAVSLVELSEGGGGEGGDSRPVTELRRALTLRRSFRCPPTFSRSLVFESGGSEEVVSEQL